MSERPIDVSVKSGATASDKITTDEKVFTREDKKARLAQVLERGMVGVRLQVDLPDDLVGQWVPKDEAEIHRMEALGYRLDRDYAPKRRLHDGGDGLSYVGDVVHMIADRETREIIDELKKERYDRMNDPKLQKEERDFKNLTQKNLGDAGIRTIDESQSHSVRRDEIAAALKPNLPI